MAGLGALSRTFSAVAGETFVPAHVSAQRRRRNLRSGWRRLAGAIADAGAVRGHTALARLAALETTPEAAKAESARIGEDAAAARWSDLQFPSSLLFGVVTT